LLMMKLLMAFALFPLNQKPDCLWMGATAIRSFNHLTSATRLSQGDPWLSAPWLLVVWLYRLSSFLN
jgi:hypothetical protein